MPIPQSTPGGARPLSGLAAGVTANDIARGYMDLSPEQVRAVAIPMFVTMDDVTQSGYDVYRVPTTHDLVIEQIRAHLVLMNPNGEGGVKGDAGEPGSVIKTGSLVLTSFRDRLAMKASNALLDLKNSDREQKIIDNHSMALATLHEAAGGFPIDLGATPQKVIAGETLRLDVRYAAILPALLITGATQYGVVLVGKLIRVQKS